MWSSVTVCKVPSFLTALLMVNKESPAQEDVMLNRKMRPQLCKTTGCFQKSPQPYSFLSQMNPVRTTISIYKTIDFEVNLSCDYLACRF
jgi:hypothetical protein